MKSVEEDRKKTVKFYYEKKFIKNIIDGEFTLEQAIRRD